MTQGGQAVLNMRLAINESYLDKDKQRKERVEWVSCVVWGRRGEALSKILTKGSLVLVEGALRSSKYQDRDGNERQKTEVLVNNVVLTGGRGGGAPAEDHDDTNGAPQQQRGQRPASAPRGRQQQQAAGGVDDYAGDGDGGDNTIPF